jgi:indole-3-glycerol phosphate synthase
MSTKTFTDILSRIADYKQKEVEERKSILPLDQLQAKPFYNRKGKSLRDSIIDPSKTGIIAEFKRKSPSAGAINLNTSVKQVTTGYAKSGASGLSVLTDTPSFGGSLDDLLTARQYVQTPILRKDFMLDEYQVYEAKAFGADAILLIAAMIDRYECEKLTGIAHKLGLEVLLEVHNASEIASHAGEFADIIGVNSRDLKSFSTDLTHAEKLYELLPKDSIKIAESGIHQPEDAARFKQMGFDGFLIGSHFMHQDQPGMACLEFSNQLKKMIG